MLQTRQATVSQFFSPAVVKTLTDARADAVLRPKEGPVTVLFCDVRGFSKQVEQSQHQLQAFLDRVSKALGVMTGAIMKHEGVIADFQGDAALAFWGWPTAREDGPLAACRAALAIHAEFNRANREPDHPLHGFRVGVAVGHGRAIAGKIGTEQQAKVGVFGPVVNHTSRLEGMTKQFVVSVLIDEPTAEYIRRHLPASEGRCRRLGRVRPKGIETPIMVSELLLPQGHGEVLTNDEISQHEQAVDAFIQGRWTDALQIFDYLPERDRAKDFLVRYAARHENQPPSGWDGIVALDEK